MAYEGLEAMYLDADQDALLMAELVARHRLLLRTGRVVDTARLDPEHHHARVKPAPRAPAGTELDA